MKKILILMATLCSITTLAGCNEAYRNDYYSSGSSNYASYPTSSVTSGYNRDYQENRRQHGDQSVTHSQQQDGYQSSSQHVQSSNSGYSSKAPTKQYRTKPQTDGSYSSPNSDSASYEPSQGYSSSASY